MDSWIQFDRAQQMVYGLAVSPYWRNNTEANYNVVATDRQGNIANTALAVRVTVSNLLRVSHTYSMRIVTDYQLFTSELSHALWWVGNVTQYFRTDMSAITVPGVKEGSVIIGWSNNSINSISPPYKCPGPEIYQQFARISDGALTNSLSQYAISSVELRLQGICSEYTTPTTTTTTTTTSTTTTPLTSTNSSTSTTTPTTTSEWAMSSSIKGS